MYEKGLRQEKPHWYVLLEEEEKMKFSPVRIEDGQSVASVANLGASFGNSLLRTPKLSMSIKKKSMLTPMNHKLHPILPGFDVDKILVHGNLTPMSTNHPITTKPQSDHGVFTLEEDEPEAQSKHSKMSQLKSPDKPPDMSSKKPLEGKADSNLGLWDQDSKEPLRVGGSLPTLALGAIPHDIVAGHSDIGSPKAD